jgi:hypothetical protein
MVMGEVIILGGFTAGQKVQQTRLCWGVKLWEFYLSLASHPLQHTPLVCNLNLLV